MAGALHSLRFPLAESLWVHHPAQARLRCPGSPCGGPGHQLLSTGRLVLQVLTAGQRRGGYPGAHGIRARRPVCSLNLAGGRLAPFGDASAAWPGYARDCAEAFPSPRKEPLRR